MSRRSKTTAQWTNLQGVRRLPTLGTSAARALMTSDVFAIVPLPDNSNLQFQGDSIVTRSALRPDVRSRRCGSLANPTRLRYLAAFPTQTTTDRSAPWMISPRSHADNSFRPLPCPGRSCWCPILLQSRRPSPARSRLAMVGTGICGIGWGKDILRNTRPD
jgi:hypothetical protein